VVNIPRCKWCGTEIHNKRKLVNQHEPNCEWKEKKENWLKRVEESKGKTFWYVDSQELILKPCVLSHYHQMIRFFKASGELDDWSTGFYENNLFTSESDAQVRLDYLKKLYLETFKYKPYLSKEIIAERINELTQIEKEITERLRYFPNFTGIDFCNVGANGIQIRGHHSQIKGYTYGSQPTIKYDFSNYLDTVDEFVDMWKKNDIPERVRGEQNMIADCEKWGWD